MVGCIALDSYGNIWNIMNISLIAQFQFVQVVLVLQTYFNPENTKLKKKAYIATSHGIFLFLLVFITPWLSEQSLN